MKLLFCLILCFFWLTSWTFAQTINGNLEGRILDEAGQPVQGVNVTVSGPHLIGTRGAASNDDGFFRIFALPGGSYSVKISHVAYQEKTISGITVPLGATAKLQDIHLQLQISEASEVIVWAEPAVMDPASTSLGENLTPAQLQGLPLERNYQAIARLLPQANESYYGDGLSIMGATGLENKFFINGVDVSDPFRGKSSTSLPYNFVREVQIKTGAYEAEYRGSLGGLMSVATYAGGNDFSGQLYGFFTNNNFSGTPRPSQTALPEKYSQYDIGGSLGGPILRDRLWFFAAYNPNFTREEVAVAGLGNLTDRQTTHIFASKLSWRLNNHNQLQLTVFGDPTTGREVIPMYELGSYTYLNEDPLLYETQRGSYNLVASGTHIINNSFLIESFASWAQVKDIQKPDTDKHLDEIFFWDDVNQTVSGGAVQSINDVSSEVSVGAKSTLMTGNHTLKAGLEYGYLTHTSDFWLRFFHQLADSTYYFQLHQMSGTFGQTLLGLFLQDSWQILRRFRLNAGVRWDPLFLRASDGRIAQKFLNQIAPRLGIVYLPGGRETEKITLSAGRYYQMLSMFIQQWHNVTNVRFQYLYWDHDPRQDPSSDSTVVDWTGNIQEDIKGMQGQHYDELTAGYERIFLGKVNFSIQGIYRTLREGIEDGVNLATGDVAFGNPGSPPLEILPRMSRDYLALELTLKQFDPVTFNYLISYVLSRTYGNYPGVFDPHLRDDRANTTGLFDVPEWVVNSTGLLPNDRTHVFKLFGSYRPLSSFTVGALLVWQSGVPLSEYGGSSAGLPLKFISQRGTRGRTPALWDLSIRTVFDVSQVLNLSYQTRLILDLFHVGSPRTAVDYDQTHYYALDENGNQTNPNPDYLQPILFQPPMSLRLGMEVGF